MNTPAAHHRDPEHPAAVAAGLELELSTYQVYDDRRELEGTIRIAGPVLLTALCGAPGDTDRSGVAFRLLVTDLSTGRGAWQTTVPVRVVDGKVESRFALPVAQLDPGYNRVEIAIGAPDGCVIALPAGTDREGGVLTTFVEHQLERSGYPGLANSATEHAKRLGFFAAFAAKKGGCAARS